MSCLSYFSCFRRSPTWEWPYPLYMVMRWVALTLMASEGFITQGKFTDILNSGGKPDFATMGLLLNFVVVIGLLILTIITAKSTASKGSSLIGKFVCQATAFAGG